MDVEYKLLDFISDIPEDMCFELPTENSMDVKEDSCMEIIGNNGLRILGEYDLEGGESKLLERLDEYL